MSNIMWSKSKPDAEAAKARRAEKARVAKLWELVEATTWTGSDGTGCFTYPELAFGGSPDQILNVPVGEILPSSVSPGNGDMRRVS